MQGQDTPGNKMSNTKKIGILLIITWVVMAVAFVGFRKYKKDIEKEIYYLKISNHA